MHVCTTNERKKIAIFNQFHNASKYVCATSVNNANCLQWISIPVLIENSFFFVHHFIQLFIIAVDVLYSAHSFNLLLLLNNNHIWQACEWNSGARKTNYNEAINEMVNICVNLMLFIVTIKITRIKTQKNHERKRKQFTFVFGTFLHINPSSATSIHIHTHTRKKNIPKKNGKKMKHRA